MSKQAPKTVSRVLDEADDYAQTLEALVAFSNVVMSQFSGDAWISRTMRLDENGLPGREISPDLTAVISTWGLVAEVKQSLPRDPALWTDLPEQIKKYDSTIHGWPGKKDAHDVLLLCNQLISFNAGKYIAESVRLGTLSLKNNLSVIAYNRNSNRRIFLFLKQETGQIGNRPLADALKPGIQVDLERVLKELSSVRFYDSEPPEIYTMSLLWINIFPLHVDRRKTRSRTAPEIDVSVQELTEELRTYYAPPGNRTVVRAQWVGGQCGPL